MCPSLQIIESVETVFVLGQSLGGPGLPQAQRLVQTGQAREVIVLERSWDAVDQTRREIEALGEERISARHVSVRPLLGTTRRAA